jgi:hypothetical protein
MMEPTTSIGGIPVDDNGNVDIIDFSFSPEPKRFQINDDIFECSPELPLGIMARAASMKFDAETLRVKGIEPILEFFDEVFIGDSSQRFRARVNNKERPIGLRHVIKILPWLMEAYGLRPTEPSQPSSQLPESTGMTSTVGALGQESIPLSSDSPAS